jgi:hypothetical protein
MNVEEINAIITKETNGRALEIFAFNDNAREHHLAHVKSPQRELAATLLFWNTLPSPANTLNLVQKYRARASVRRRKDEGIVRDENERLALFGVAKTKSARIA